MQANTIKFYEFGRPQDVLKIETETIEPPKANEVLVRMLTRPINPSDLIPITGAYSHRIPLPSTPGYEGVGVVEKIGSSVSPHLIGKRILPLRGNGTWQEFVHAPADFSVPIPRAMDDFTAAQMYINPLTAWVICTKVLQLRSDDIVLVNACGSAIGRIFIQLSIVLGFQLIAVTRNSSYTEDLMQLGASYVIDTSTVSLYKTVMEVTNGKGAHAAIDLVGGDSGNTLAFCVQSNGDFISLGLLSGIQLNWAHIIKKAKVKATIFHLRNWNKHISAKTWQETFHDLIKLIEEQKLCLMSAKDAYDLSNVKKALDVHSSKKSTGKVFLTSD